MTAAIVAYMKANAGVSALVGTRVYGATMPKTEIPNLPRYDLIVRPAGGIERFATDTLVWARFDFHSYGGTELEAGTLDRAVFDALRAIATTVQGTVLLRSAGIAGGGYYMPDGVGDWPRMFRSATVLTDIRSL